VKNERNILLEKWLLKWDKRYHLLKKAEDNSNTGDMVWKLPGDEYFGCWNINSQKQEEEKDQTKWEAGRKGRYSTFADELGGTRVTK